MGKRLGEYTKDNTKCMVHVNGVRLIDRLLKQLNALNLRRIVIVIGYEGTKLKEYIGNDFNGTAIEYVNNPIYDKTNNIYSLVLAKTQLQEDDTLLIESDLVFDNGMFRLLTDNPYPNLALVAKYEPWMDGTMVRIDEDNNILNFVPKAAFNFNETDCYYKTVNIYKFSKEFSKNKYVPFLDAYSKAVGNNEYYENVLSIISFLNNHDLKALPITDEKWYEIDDKQDLDIAEAIFAEGNDALCKLYDRYGGYWRFPKLLDYCYLVNPYFPSSKIVDELQANFRTLLTGYPSGIKINTILASKCWCINEEYIIPGNGAAELIKLLMESITGHVGVVRPTFEEYPNRLSKANIICYIPNNANYRYGAIDLIDYFGNLPISTLLLVNPDNPSGNFIPKDDVTVLAQWCEEKGIQLIVDESFVDFTEGCESNTLLNNSILEAFPHLIVIKSISKSYGIPGLRLGILASSNKEMISCMKKQISIWNINSFAEYFMQIFNKYSKDYKKACGKFIEERKDFESKLHAIKYIRVMPTQANFFLIEILPPFKANDIVTFLLSKHNILTRDCSAKYGFDGKQYMRIAIRNHNDNERLINALKSLEQ